MKILESSLHWFDVLLGLPLLLSLDLVIDELLDQCLVIVRRSRTKNRSGQFINRRSWWRLALDHFEVNSILLLSAPFYFIQPILNFSESILNSLPTMFDTSLDCFMDLFSNIQQIQTL